MTPRYGIVIPTTGRASLAVLLRALDAAPGPPPERVVIVDDRPVSERGGHLPVPRLSLQVRVLQGGGRGPAAARNLGWHALTTPWASFLDDDVVVAADWRQRLADDLRRVAGDVAGSQGRIVVPLPADRGPTDAERGTAGLASARWITADMAYRRDVLALAGGFDERFRRAYREDADLALRITEAGYRIVTGQRTTTHPARPTGFAASLRAQRGNADDALMRRKHGPGWRRRIGEGHGRLRVHALTTATAAVALAGGCHRPSGAVARAAAAAWAVLTAQFALRRILPGPRDAGEIARMLVTSVAIPPAACGHRLRGWWRHRGTRREPRVARPGAVLFDRDGTLVHDVAYNGDPARVRPVEGAAAALARLRAVAVPVGVVSNQSGVARGLLTGPQVTAVNDRIEAMLGPFGSWQVCPHGETEGCDCRKPQPGLIRKAAADLGVPVTACVVIGDTGADVAAAAAAGARGILVPTDRTLRSEVAGAPEVAATLGEAVTLALRERAP